MRDNEHDYNLFKLIMQDTKVMENTLMAQLNDLSDEETVRNLFLGYIKYADQGYGLLKVYLSNGEFAGVITLSNSSKAFEPIKDLQNYLILGAFFRIERTFSVQFFNDICEYIKLLGLGLKVAIQTSNKLSIYTTTSLFGFKFFSLEKYKIKGRNDRNIEYYVLMKTFYQKLVG